jgi:hypothetical protein
MATITPTLTSFGSAVPGNGVCVFFWDSDKEFYPGGIGGALGYAPYTGDMTYTANESAAMNGIEGAYLGIGFDVKGEFSTTHDSKPGANILGTANSTITSCPVSTITPNTITTRGGELSSYKVISTTPDLSTYPLSGGLDETYDNNNNRFADSPPRTLHQSVTSAGDAIFTSVKIIMQNDGKRVRVEMKDPVTGKYYPYQIIDLDSGLGERPVPNTSPTKLRVGIGFSTSESVMRCDIKNFSIYGTYSEPSKVGTFLKPRTAPKHTRIITGTC